MDDLDNILNNVDDSLKPYAKSMIQEFIFVNQRLEELKTYPSIETHPNNPAKQRQTAAGKQYREYLQQKTNIFKSLCALIGKKNVEEESPLRAYLKGIERRKG